jgi:hypothetical protein
MNKFAGVAIATVALLMAGASVAQAGFPTPLEARLCARTMCNAMRDCETYIPQPTPVFDKVEKPGGNTGTTAVSNDKGSKSAQGSISQSCRETLLEEYESCVSETPPIVVDSKWTATTKVVEPATTPAK